MTDTINWLMEGDPVIRWQTMRDLLDRPEEEWLAERSRTTETGWGAAFLAALQPDLVWPEGRWTGTVWTLLTVMDCGLPSDHPKLQAAAHHFLDAQLSANRSKDPSWLTNRIDLCHVGFWLRIGAYFCHEDSRLPLLAATLMQTQMADGGWNCRIRNYPKTTHSSFHTTFNILEGLSQAAIAKVISPEDFRASEARALEFMLEHQLYRSDKTGNIVDERFLQLTYPSHWHYTVLRALDYIRQCPQIADTRVNDPVKTLMSRRDAYDRWPVEKRIPGTTLFDMEKLGQASRWNTLRMMRTLRKWNNTNP